MDETRRFELMLVVSIVLHLLFIGVAILLSTLRSAAIQEYPTHDAQQVTLYELSELPEMPTPEIQPSVQQPLPEALVAFRNVSTIIQQPTAVPTPMPTLVPPTPTPRPEPTPTPVPKPRPTRTPRPRLISTPIPSRSPFPTPTEQPTVAFDVPRRQPVMQTDTSPQELQSAVQQEQQRRAVPTPGSGRPSGSSSSFVHESSTNGTPMMFETEEVFPYPEYLEHIKEKIEGLWFPQGSGTVSIYLIIERNGKILKSGVDKGSGVGVDKLRESIRRVFENVKRFHPLPAEYESSVLRVRITVRR